MNVDVEVRCMLVEYGVAGTTTVEVTVPASRPETTLERDAVAIATVGVLSIALVDLTTNCLDLMVTL
jgi:hypothetical protein